MGKQKSEIRSASLKIQYYNFLFYTLLGVATVICLASSLSFEMSYLEPFILKVTTEPFITSINPFRDNLTGADRGFLYKNLIKATLPFVGENFKYLRLVSVLFFLFSLILLYETFKSTFSQQVALLASLFLFMHYQLFDTSNLVSPYSCSLFFMILFYRSHALFDGTKKSAQRHAALCLINVLVHFTSLVPISISLFLLYRKKVKPFIVQKVYYTPFILYSVYKLIIVSHYRVIYRSSSQNFYDVGVWQNTHIFLNFFDLYFPPGEALFSSTIPKIYQIATIFSFLTLSFYLFRLFRKKLSSLFQMLRVYLIIMATSYFALNLLQVREISTRYYYGLLPLFYLYLANEVCHSKKSILRGVVSVVFLATTLYVKIHNININLNHMLREPLISMQKAIFNSSHIASNSLICFIPSNHFGEYIQWLNEHNNFSQNKKFFSDKNFECENLSDEKLQVHKNMYLVTLGEHSKAGNFCKKLSGDECPSLLKNSSIEQVYNQKRNRNNFGFNIFVINSQLSDK